MGKDLELTCTAFHLNPKGVSCYARVGKVGLQHLYGWFSKKASRVSVTHQSLGS